METNQFLELQFEHIHKSPASWLVMAHHLKWCADRVCWFNVEYRAYRLTEDEHMSLGFVIPTYRMLLGLSFENLLKGIVIAQGKSVAEGGKLKKEFKTHDTQSLLSEINWSKFSLSTQERELLCELKHYVVWQGRYPIPTKKEEYRISFHESTAYRIEQELWTRISEYLQDIGWCLKANGTSGSISTRSYGFAYRTRFYSSLNSEPA